MDSIADVFPHPIEFFRVRLALTVHDGQEEGGHNGPHTDHESDHYAALFYINSTSGNTTFFEEYDDPIKGDVEERWWRATTQEYHPIKRVEPVANRLFAFDGHQFHASANPNPVDRPNDWTATFIEDYSETFYADWPATGPMKTRSRGPWRRARDCTGTSLTRSP